MPDAKDRLKSEAVGGNMGKQNGGKRKMDSIISSKQLQKTQSETRILSQ